MEKSLIQHKPWRLTKIMPKACPGMVQSPNAAYPLTERVIFIRAVSAAVPAPKRRCTPSFQIVRPRHRARFPTISVILKR
jgi:hypothetical protein